MRILYGIQGTGNGHISRALEIIPHLAKYGKTDILTSGYQAELKLPCNIKYKCHGLGFVFGKKGGIDILETYKKSRLKIFYKEVRDLPVEDYDIIISDFEPVTAWAGIYRNKKCVGLSNQVSLLSPKAPKPKSEDFIGKFIIRNYAPTFLKVGLAYSSWEKNIFTPVVRNSLRRQEISNKGHYTVYLPSYSDKKIREILGSIRGRRWHVFSKKASTITTDREFTFFPLQKDGFDKSMLSAEGVITAAGFGTTSEVLFLGKKLLVIPQKHQYEQACNAFALSQMGVAVIKKLRKKQVGKIETWIENGTPVHVDYPDCTAEMTDYLVSSVKPAGNAPDSFDNISFPGLKPDTLNN